VTQRGVGLLAFGAYAATVAASNWMLLHIGTERPGGIHTVPVGLGMEAPSGVVMVGIGLTLRDLVQRLLGLRMAALAVLIGAVLSASFGVGLAVASGATFLVAEGVDLLVFTVFQRTFMFAVFASNVVGALLDSLLFLTISFGPYAALTFAGPSVLGKVESSVVTLIVLAVALEVSRRVGRGRARPRDRAAMALGPGRATPGTPDGPRR
jgi:queuosine precursor transporter